MGKDIVTKATSFYQQNVQFDGQKMLWNIRASFLKVMFPFLLFGFVLGDSDVISQSEGNRDDHRDEDRKVHRQISEPVAGRDLAKELGIRGDRRIDRESQGGHDHRKGEDQIEFLVFLAEQEAEGQSEEDRQRRDLICVSPRHDDVDQNRDHERGDGSQIGDFAFPIAEYPIADDRKNR